MTSSVFHPQSHDWGETLEQVFRSPNCTQCATAKMAAPCSGCVFTVCVCSLLCSLGWVNCRAQILSMGHHTWQRPFLCFKPPSRHQSEAAFLCHHVDFLQSILQYFKTTKKQKTKIFWYKIWCHFHQPYETQITKPCFITEIHVS